MQHSILNISELLRNLDVDPQFLKRVGGKKGIESLYFKKEKGFAFSPEESILYFESFIFISSAYARQYGRRLFLVDLSETLH